MAAVEVNAVVGKESHPGSWSQDAWKDPADNGFAELLNSREFGFAKASGLPMPAPRPSGVGLLTLSLYYLRNLRQKKPLQRLCQVR